MSVQATANEVPEDPETPDDPGTPPFDDAQQINLRNNRGRVTGRLQNAGDQEIYSFTADADGRMIMTVRGRGGLDTMLTVYDADGNEVAFNDDWRGTNSRVRLDVQAGQTYYVQVSGFGDSVGRFRLNLRLRPAPVAVSNSAAYTATDFVFARNPDWYMFGIG